VLNISIFRFVDSSLKILINSFKIKEGFFIRNKFENLISVFLSIRLRAWYSCYATICHQLMLNFFTAVSHWEDPRVFKFFGILCGLINIFMFVCEMSVKVISDCLTFWAKAPLVIHVWAYAHDHIKQLCTATGTMEPEHFLPQKAK